MRNKIYLFLFLISIHSILFAQKTAKQKPAVKTNYQNSSSAKTSNIKSQSAFEYKFQMGERAHDSSWLYTKSFDPKGKLTESISSMERIMYTYNDKGKLIQESFYDSDKKIRYKDNYQYNDNGTLKEKIEYGERGQKIFSVVSTFNARKQENERSVLDSMGKLQSTQLFSYDDKGNILIESENNASGKIITKRISTYDSKNNLTGLTIFKNDTVTSKYSYEYNLINKTNKTLCYNSDGSINYKTIFDYTTKGKIAEEITYQGTGFTKINYQYDANSNMTQELKINEKNLILEKVRCNYNSKGLLTEEIQYNSFDEPESTIRYDYELYPD